MSEGFSLLAVVLYGVLLLMFRRRVFALFDPLSFYLFQRIAVPLAFLLLAADRFPTYSTVYLWGCFGLFLFALFFSAKPLRPPAPLEPPEALRVRRRLFHWLVLLFLIKAATLASVVSALPIFGEGGASAYIDFDATDKVASTLLFGIGLSEFILACALLPGSAGRQRAVLWAIVVFSGVTPLLMGKKSSVLTVLFALAVAKYVHGKLNPGEQLLSRRAQFVLVGALFTAATGWAFWIFSKSGIGAERLSALPSPVAILDYICYQWAHVYDMFFALDVGTGFLNAVQYNPWTYFFHSFLKVFGSGAFEYSIGPALAGYMYGEVTGHGVNPTFAVEGYVVFGFVGGLVFSALSGYMIGRARTWLDRLHPNERAIMLIVLLLPILTAWPVDSLLFVKMLTVSISIYVLGMAFFWGLRTLKLPTPTVAAPAPA